MLLPAFARRVRGETLSKIFSWILVTVSGRRHFSLLRTGLPQTGNGRNTELGTPFRDLSLITDGLGISLRP